jgi:hypothetical protein
MQVAVGDACLSSYVSTKWTTHDACKRASRWKDFVDFVHLCRGEPSRESAGEPGL